MSMYLVHRLCRSSLAERANWFRTDARRRLSPLESGWSANTEVIRPGIELHPPILHAGQVSLAAYLNAYDWCLLRPAEKSRRLCINSLELGGAYRKSLEE